MSVAEFIGSDTRMPVATRRTAVIAGTCLAVALGAACCQAHTVKTSVDGVGPRVTASPPRNTTTSSHPSEPLLGKSVGVDPGHNGLNYTAPATINAQIWNGREYEACNTTGTDTDSGYTEAQFNWNVAQYLTADLRAEGATVVLTRSSNNGVGPCVNQRAAIFNQAHTDVSIAIHADGGPPDGRGFAVLQPVADGPNDGVIGLRPRLERS